MVQWDNPCACTWGQTAWAAPQNSARLLHNSPLPTKYIVPSNSSVLFRCCREIGQKIQAFLRETVNCRWLNTFKVHLAPALCQRYSFSFTWCCIVTLGDSDHVVICVWRVHSLRGNLQREIFLIKGEIESLFWTLHIGPSMCNRYSTHWSKRPFIIFQKRNL